VGVDRLWRERDEEVSRLGVQGRGSEAGTASVLATPRNPFTTLLSHTG